MNSKKDNSVYFYINCFITNKMSQPDRGLGWVSIKPEKEQSFISLYVSDSDNSSS
jgi:hypothetical protein